MESAEIARRFGPPSLKLATNPGEEMLTYARKDSKVDVTMRNGKAAVVRRSGGATGSLAGAVR